MNKLELMKLAEFDTEAVEQEATDYETNADGTAGRYFVDDAYVEGAQWENARLLPLIEALAEDIEKLVEALRSSPCTGNGAIHLMSCNKCAVLADHAERMKRLCFSENARNIVSTVEDIKLASFLPDFNKDVE